MTGYTVHTGSTEKFTAGWDSVFSGDSGKKKKKAAPSRAPKKKTKRTGKKVKTTKK